MLVAICIQSSDVEMARFGSLALAWSFGAGAKYHEKLLEYLGGEDQVMEDGFRRVLAMLGSEDNYISR